MELYILLTDRICAQAHVCNYFPFIAGKCCVFINIIHGRLCPAWKMWIFIVVPSESCGCIVLIYKTG